MWNESAAFHAYAAYGADLIRTGGIMVGATPSVIFRATVLFQRFEKVANEKFRARYCTCSEMARRRPSRAASSDSSFFPSSSFSSDDGDEQEYGCGGCGGTNSRTTVSPASEGQTQQTSEGTTEPRVEYILPAHVDAYEKSRAEPDPLVDLLAPLDYCIYNLDVQSDISFLTAACLLVAAKLEQPHVTVGHLTVAFEQLDTCRRDKTPPGVEDGHVSSSRKRDQHYLGMFKAAIVKAEELVLHILGFQTFVDSPYKYCQVFLSLIVDDAQTSAGYAQWLQRAVSWLNDAPRSPDLALTAAPTLAAFAIHHATPAAVTLPANWFLALGVTEAAFEQVRHTYTSCTDQKWTQSAPDTIAAIRADMPPPRYVTLQQWEQLQTDLDTSLTSSASAVASSREGSRSSVASATLGHAHATTLSSNIMPNENSRELELVSPTTTATEVPTPASTTTTGGVEELATREFLDLRQLRRQRHREAKEREEDEKKEKALQQHHRAKQQKPSQSENRSPKRSARDTSRRDRGRRHSQERGDRKRSRSPSARHRKARDTSYNRKRTQRHESARGHGRRRR